MPETIKAVPLISAQENNRHCSAALRSVGGSADEVIAPKSRPGLLDLTARLLLSQSNYAVDNHLLRPARQDEHLCFRTDFLERTGSTA